MAGEESPIKSDIKISKSIEEKSDNETKLWNRRKSTFVSSGGGSDDDEDGEIYDDDGDVVPVINTAGKSEKTKKKLQKMQRRKIKRCLIYPEWFTKSIWDIVIALVLVVSCILSPVFIAFESDSDGNKVVWKIVNSTIDIFFLVDIFVIFFSAYYDEDFRIIEDRKIIAIGYLKGWFTIDCLSIVPFDLLFSMGSDGGTADMN